MEVLSSGTKRQKCLHITSEQENEVVTSTTLHPLIPFQREEEEMAQIMKLNLVKEAAVEGQEENDDKEKVRKAGKDEEESTGENREKSVRHQSIEKLQKAQAELTQLVALTENVNTEAHLVLLTRTAGEKKMLKGDDSTLFQRMCFVQKYFIDAESPLHSERERMERLVKQRQTFAESLAHLKKVWRLKIQHSKGGSLVGRKSKSVSSSIGIDCSFGGADRDNLWVPLVMGGNTAPGHTVLPASETDRKMVSLSLSLSYVPTNTTLAHFTAWSSSRERAMAWKDTPGHVQGAEGDAHNEAIHNHCHKRQHESLSREIMHCLKMEASSQFDRWIISPKVVVLSSSDNLSPVSRATTTSSHTPREDANDLSSAELRDIIQHARLSETLDVSFLNRGVVEIALSQHISLKVTLTPLASDNGGGDAASNDDGGRSIDTAEMQSLYSSLKAAYLICASEYVSFLGGHGSSSSSSSSSSSGILDGNSAERGMSVPRMGQEEAKDGAGNSSGEEPRARAAPKDLLRSLCDHLKRSLSAIYS